MKKLKKCPSCGWIYATITTTGTERLFGRRFYVQCAHCFWRSKKSHFRRQAARFWNKREGGITIRREYDNAR